jgi:hypothetical protein
MCRTICILRDIWAWYPPVGVFIGMLAAVSVALPFLREMKGMGKQERALWTLLMFALVFLEFKSIYQERATHEKEQEKARAEQLSQFSSIAGRIDKSIVNNQRHFDDVTGRMEGLWEETTGGSSYLYFDVLSAGGPIEMDIPGANKGEMLFNGIPHFVGTHPLHNVYVATAGPNGWSPDIDYGTVLPKEIGRPRPSVPLNFLPDKDRQVFNLFINTSNGSYSQNILFLKVGDKWLWKSYFAKEGKKKPSRVWSAPGFPKGQELNEK